MLFILPSYVFLLDIIIILLLTCPISSQLRLKNHVDEKSMKDTSFLFRRGKITNYEKRLKACI
ncbi:hypothetical protein CN386_15120 [Bacillus cereus]|nr:hypothetical protein MLA2C4_02505 [Bacillus mobilis]PDZ68291.1 hypothetical protein CON30_10205 [Bacillus cereus]PER28889.1 hypothetical protein CN490_14250 [Bacillus cereus]PEU77180.1 hypothetical protein CN386_15120 [Bacillus cereus]PGT77883.1 hypothetical protein COD14_06730 [Bacillus cereus]